MESSASEVQLVPASNGITVHTDDAAVESTPASLVFHVKENATEYGSVNLPITMDETAPHVSGGSYENGQFLVSYSEEIFAQLVDNPNVTVEVSALGDFTDTRTLVPGADFVPGTLNGNQLSILLTDTGKSSILLQSGSKFRINISGYADRAANQVTGQATINVSQW